MKFNCTRSFKNLAFIIIFYFIIVNVHSQQFISSAYSDYIRLSELAGDVDLTGTNYHTYNSFKDDLKAVSNTGVWKSRYLDGFNLEEDFINIEPINTFFSYNSEAGHGS